MNEMRDRLAALGVKVSVYPPKWDGPRTKIEARVPLAADMLYSVWWNMRDEIAADWLGRPDAFTWREDAELRGSARTKA